MSLLEGASQTKLRKYILYSESRGEMKENDFTAKHTDFFPLLGLPKEILIIIFGYLDPRDLVNLSQSCEPLNAIARHSSFWSKVDLRNHYMMLCQFKEFATYLVPTTRFIALKGCVRFFTEDNPPSQICSLDVLKAISGNCKNLKILVLEEHYFEPKKVFECAFISSVKCLSLKNCQLHPAAIYSVLYFRLIYCYMPSLEVLILDGCDWITPNCFWYLSKCPRLRLLSLQSCPYLNDGFLCVGDTMRGFKSLKILDLRGSFVCHTDFCLLSCIKSLRHLLVECPTNASNASNADSVMNSGDGSQEPKLPAGVACTCLAEPQEVVVVKWERRIKFWNTWMPNQHRPFTNFTLISDSSVLRFGDQNMLHSVFSNNIIRGASNRFNHHLTHLTIKNYKHVTDRSLAHLSHMSSLKYLDVRGSSVTPEGVSNFRARRADVKLMSDYVFDAPD